MFDDETINAFSGGYRVSESGVGTFFGLPTVSKMNKVIAFPVSLSISALVKRNKSVVWKGINTIELPYEVSKLTNDWFDPIKLMTNIALQRGWKNAPYILVDELLGYQVSLAYYSAFVDLLVRSFSLVNDVTLSLAELLQISGEIQDKIRGYHFAYETIARQHGKDGNLLFYESSSKSYRNEIVNFEPFSIFLISENFIDSNPGFQNFQKNFRKFIEGKMMSRDPSSLSYPYGGIRNHISAEEDTYNRMIESLNKNDTQLLVDTISQYSQSIGYNLGVLSDFQKKVATLLEKYGVKTYVFNISEHSGSVLVFADSLELTKIKDNAIRDYYNLTNRTIRFDELQISTGPSQQLIRL